ncbi:alpha/beta hydrolase [Fulvivirga sp. 29W222]|uniref:Alpha/beta hydrolase n=1 Tax=Fulvivirga marina TaxID=2494733 RepID=A0A937KBU5_9BACT|nr:alpha/beta fold hydrolase [Fulvivirga marina]MBL6447406.1 alpha/beta hydrolase [Fulvivirga marina]
MKAVKWISIIVLFICAAYFLGPQVESPQLTKDLPTVATDLRTLEEDIKRHEEQTPNIKPDNESTIIWADSAYKKTPYSIVYLHGFSASQGEGAPLHKEIAKRYGCNLYLPRLYGHGVADKEPMIDLTADKLLNSAKKAIAVAKQLGEHLIILATSTGGTFALYLAENDPDIAGLILYSPNVKIYDPNSWLLDEPWGLQLARLVKGSNYNRWEIDPEREQYWTNGYRLEALTHLEELIEETMTTKTFATVTQPVFLGYYYKNDSAQDNTVSVPAMLEMYDQLGTPESLKRKVAFSEVNHHVIGSYLTSEDLESVRQETFSFIEEVLKLQPYDTVE